MKTKIIKKEDFIPIRDKLKSENKKISLCHGVYDLIHPGHILHLQQAKEIADILIVSITSAPFMKKGPDRPYFNDEYRLMTLSVLEMVDYVILSEEVTAFGMIETVRPDFYVKGAEYAVHDDDVTGNIKPEIEAVIKHGGDIYYTTGETFSSTKLINTAFSAVRPKVAAVSRELKNAGFDIKYMQRELEKLSTLKILVVGDVIIDEYISCSPQGLMSKDQVISTKYTETNRYLGGSLAIANHLAGFSKNVTLCTMAGTESDIHSDILNGLGSKMFLDLDFNIEYATIIKRKYITKMGAREEYRKLFSINYLPDMNKDNINKQRFYDKLKNNLNICDIVVVCDYGHGLIDDTALKILYDSGKYMSVNCQTNSSNYGLNLITKYERANHFALDENEMKLALKDEKTDKSVLTAKLKELLKSDYGFLTLGSKGAIGIGTDGSTFSCPALILSIKDTIGAGDAFYAMSAMCAYANMPIAPATFLGNAAGAIIANVVSNSEAIDRAKVLKFAGTILNV